MNCSHWVRWMIVNCTYFLLKHGAKQCCLYIPTFCWQTKRHVVIPPTPQRHNDVILEQKGWRRPPKLPLWSYLSTLNPGLDLRLFLHNIYMIPFSSWVHLNRSMCSFNVKAYEKWNNDIMTKPARQPLDLGEALTRNRITTWSWCSSHQIVLFHTLC